MSKKAATVFFVIILVGLLIVGCGGTNENGLGKKTVVGNWILIDDPNTVYMFNADGSFTIQNNGEEYGIGKWYIEDDSLCLDEISIFGADPIEGLRSCQLTKIEDGVLMHWDMSTNGWVNKLKMVDQ